MRRCVCIILDTNFANEMQRCDMSPEPILAGETTAAEDAPSSSSPQENLSASPPQSAGAFKRIAPAIRSVGFYLSYDQQQFRSCSCCQGRQQCWPHWMKSNCMYNKCMLTLLCMTNGCNALPLIDDCLSLALQEASPFDRQHSVSPKRCIKQAIRQTKSTTATSWQPFCSV